MMKKKEKPENKKDWRDYEVLATYRENGNIVVIRKGELKSQKLK